MPRLDVYTHSDAEVHVMDAALTRVARAVGHFSGELPPGLYKIRVSRAGTYREQLLELTDAAQEVQLPVNRFAAISPIARMLADPGAVEKLACAALGRGAAPKILVLAHQSAANDGRKPFGGALLFPWRGTKHAVRLDDKQSSRKLGDELWSAVAVAADPLDGPFVLELRSGSRISRQSVLLAEGWQTRIFLRGFASDMTVDGTLTRDAAPFDVSVQMARPDAPVVYGDAGETVEVARNALDLGRAIFTSADLVHQLLGNKYDNPVTGLTGLHLFLDARAKAKSGDASYAMAVGAQDAQAVADEVLVNLTRLLTPARVAALQGTNGPAGVQQSLLYPDPAWPEPSDLTALRVRAGRCQHRVLVPSPPMFRVSWDVLKSHAGRDGLTWISRDLWRATGAAGSAGPYLAWAKGLHSVQRTVQRITEQFASQAEAAKAPSDTIVGSNHTAPAVEAVAEAVSEGFAGAEDVLHLAFAASETARRPISTQPFARQTALTNEEDLAASFGLPLSIFQKAPGKNS